MTSSSMIPRGSEAFRWACRSWLGAVLGLGLGGCTVVLDHDPKQCETTSDCTDRGLTDTVCSAENTCVRNLDYCATNSECIDRAGRAEFICDKTVNRCVELTSKQCPRILPRSKKAEDYLRSENVLVLGLEGIPNAQLPLLSHANALELAQDDFETVEGGLPGLNGEKRHVVMVSCELSPFDTAGLKTSMDHLIKNLHVPIIYGPFPLNFMSIALPIAIENDVMLFTGGYEIGDNFQDNPARIGILFNNNYSANILAPTSGKLLSNVIEPMIRMDHALAASDSIKVAVVRSGDTAQEGLVSELFRSLKYNGKTAAQNRVNDDYAEFDFGPLADPMVNSNVLDAALKVAEYKPNVVVLTSAAEQAIPLILAIEAAYPDVAHYINPPSAIFPALQDWVGSDETRRRRVWNVLGGQSYEDIDYQRLVSRLESTYPDGPKGLLYAGFVGAPSYDQYYFTMYGIHANWVAGPNLTPRPETGSNIGEMMLTKLTDGQYFKDPRGPANSILPVTSKLLKGESVVVKGAFTDSRFDQSGNLSTKGIVMCLKPKAEIDLHPDEPFQQTGLFYDPATGELTGTNSCFE